ncbi:MAG: glycosyltransferase family 39 protein [Deltaproteobacteria bacterium]|nr:glycosyltransferase family 39 protein [Deltaproteobacteria bacterium]MBI3388889.1 glycosyltransferase family 39 protein [Deltaproteobacteria bacterium]
MSRAHARRWASAVVGLGSLLIGITIFRTSLTDDEPYSYAFGHRIVFDGNFVRPGPFEASKLPVLALAALPERIGNWLGLDRRLAERALSLTALHTRERSYIVDNLPVYGGRLVTALFYLGIGVLVFAWGLEVYGPSGALGATLLIAFLPTLLGHAAAATTDAAATFAVLAAVYALARGLLDPTIERILLAGLACGFALLTKYSAAALAPLALIMVGIRTLTAEPIESKIRVAQAALSAVVLTGLVATVVLSAGFAFQHPLTNLNELACASRVMQALRGWIGGVALPLPYEYLTGLDQVLQQDQDRTAGGAVYLLGTLSEHGLPSFYLIATALKTPLPFLLLVLARPWRWHRRYTDLVWLAPIAWFAIEMSYGLNSQVGLRYLLPVFPFTALLAGAAWDHGRPRRWRQLATALGVLAVIEAAWNCPHYLSYFNQLIGSRVNAYRYLADSNLDWDQARFELWRWEERQQPGTYFLDARYEPRAGLVVVRASELVGVYDVATYRWLREANAHGTAHLIDSVGDAFLVFAVDPKVVLPATEAGQKSGPPGE